MDIKYDNMKIIFTIFYCEKIIKFRFKQVVKTFLVHHILVELYNIGMNIFVS